MVSLFMALLLGTLLIYKEAESQIIVAKDGSGTFKTIGDAIKAVGSSGDDIIVKPGVYTENLRIEGRRDINILAQGDVWIKNTGSENSITLIKCYNITITGIKVNSIISLNDCEACTISGSTFKNSNSGGISVTNSLGVKIFGNVFTHCSPVGILIDNSQQTIIQNNVMHDNTANEGILITKSYGVDIKNNTIAYNHFVTLSIGEECEKMNISSNIVGFNVVPNGLALLTVKCNTDEIELLRNVFYRNNDTKGLKLEYNSTRSKDNVSADPLFIDGAGRNFTLKNISPCIGKGENGINVGADFSNSGFPIDFEEQYEDGVAQYNVRKYAQSIQTLKKLLNVYPGNADVWVALGNSYLRLNQFEEGIASYQISLKIRPDGGVHYNLACAYALQGHVSDGLNWLDRALQMGGINYGDIANDPDLNALRKTETFAKLLKKYNLD